MTIEPDEILSILDDVCIAVGEILLRHRQLREGMLDSNAIAASQGRIEQRQAEIGKEREKIRKARESIRRRRELEKIRKDHEKDITAEATLPARLVPVMNGSGAVVGWLQSVGNGRVNVLDQRGNVVAHEIRGRTYDGSGRFAGRGSQGLRLLGHAKKKEPHE